MDCEKLLNFKNNFKNYINNKFRNLRLDCPLNNDVWAYSLIGKNGFFIEIGAGRSGNSTFILEKSCGWTGLLIEPVEKFIVYLKHFRKKTKILQNLVLDEDNKEINFYEFIKDPHYSSINIEDIIDKRIKNKNENINIDFDIKNNKLKTLSLETIIKNENIKSIDYLALDAENSELKILQGMNIEINRPKLISSESDDVIDFLIQNNYEQVINPFKDSNINYEFYFKDKLFFK